MNAAPSDPPGVASPARHAPYAYWLLASIPVALAIDACLTGLADFAWCGFSSCLYPPSPEGLRISLLATVALLFGILLVTFLALALPPWTAGWKRPAIAGGIGLVAVGVASALVFAR